MTATGKMIELLKGDLYRQSKDSKSVSDYTQGADNGLTFVMMKDVDYNDDETWNKYLDEMTIDEMTTQLSDLFGTAEAASVNRPAYAAGDGTASVGGNTYAKEYGDAVTSPVSGDQCARQHLGLWTHATSWRTGR